jgi:hypothetical protein
MIRLESRGNDSSMGMSFRGKGVNPSYTLSTIWDFEASYGFGYEHQGNFITTSRTDTV